MESRIKNVSKKLFMISLSFLMLFSTMLSTNQAFAEGGERSGNIEKTVTDLNLARLSLYEFKCRQENMQVVSMGSGTMQENIAPNGSWKKSTVFMHKYAKTPHQQNYNDALELLFTNAGEVNGKKVNVRVKVTRLQLNPTAYYGKQSNFNDPNAGVPFLTVDQNWGDSGIQLMDYIYPNHPGLQNNNEMSFNIKTDVTATLEYADGSPSDLRLTMLPADIDVKPGNAINPTTMTSFNEGFGIHNLNQSIDKIVYNRNADLKESDEADNWHWWYPGPGITSAGTSGEDEFNKTGFAIRSKSNSISFAYNSAVPSGGLFRFFVEQPYPKTPKKAVDKQEAPKTVGEPINYTVTYTVPTPGKDIIDDIKSLKFVDTFDKKVDFKGAVVKLDGKTLVEGQDYELITKPDFTDGQDYTEINITNKNLFTRQQGGKVYEITYKTETNQNALVEGENKVINSSAKMYFDNVPVHTNTVETKLLPPTKPKKEVFESKNPATSIDGNMVKGGTELLYKVSYTNTVGRADDVTITDAVPEHTKYVKGSADNGGIEKDGVITWKKQALGNGETFTVTFKVKVDEDIDGKPVDNQAKVIAGKNSFDTNKTHNPTPTEPKKEVFKGGTTTNIDGKRVEPEQELTYAITYKNTTDKDVTATITDKLPKHTSFVSAENGGTESGGVVTWNVAVAKDQSITVKFTVKVDKNVNGAPIDNVAKVNDGVNDYKTNETHNPTPTEPKKEVFKGGTTTKIDGKLVQPEEELTYAITYKNTTDKDVTATITDKLPKHTSFVSAENGGTESGGVVTWNVAVAKNQSVTVKFTVKVDKDVNGAPIDNIAKVNDGTNSYDTNETHNPTPTEPKKEVFKFGTTTNIDGKVVQPDQKLTYQITYKNTTGEERDVTITDKLPAHTSFVSADNGGKFANGKITWTAKVADGQTLKVTFTVKVDKNVNGEILKNTAIVNDGVNDFNTNTIKNPTPKVPKNPDTGDFNNIMLLMLMLLGSSGALVSGMAIKRRREE